MAKRSVTAMLIGMGMMGGLAVTGLADDEEEVSIDQVPAAVKATILKETANGKITEIERETEKGQTVYEVEFILDGKEIEKLLKGESLPRQRKTSHTRRRTRTVQNQEKA